MKPTISLTVLVSLASLMLSGCTKKNPAEHIISQKRFESVLSYIGNPKNIKLYDFVVVWVGRQKTLENAPTALFNTVAKMTQDAEINRKLGFVRADGRVEPPAQFYDVTIKSCTAEPKKDKPDITSIKCSFSYIPMDGFGKKYNLINAEIDMDRDKSDHIVINRVKENS